MGEDVVATTMPVGSVAIIVVNFGSHALIEKNLMAFRGDARRQVIVVDNFRNAKDRSAIRALTVANGWVLVARPDNRGFGAAVNRGAAKARELGFSTVLLINPDASIDVLGVDQLALAAAAHPDTLFAPRLIDSSGATVFDGAELDMFTGATAGVGRSAVGHRLEPWLTGACLALDLALFERLNGFDERYFLYWEDVELSVRARQAGAQVKVRSDIVGVHDEGQTHNVAGSRAKSDIYYFYNCRNRLLFAADHLSGQERLSWVIRTPAQSWAILMRGGRRQLIESRSGLWASIRGSLAGLRLVWIATVRRGPVDNP